MNKKKWKKCLSIAIVLAMLVTPLQGITFTDALFEKAGVTKKAMAAQDTQTDTEQTPGTYPYFANEPDTADSTANLGSAEHPLEIANAVQLYNLYLVGKESASNENYVDADGNEVKYMQCHYKVTGNIDLADLKEAQTQITNWPGIGSGTYSGFQGSFDGGSQEGYTISNMTISSDVTLKSKGLFSNVAEGSTIENISLINPSISGKLSSWTEACGFIVGKAEVYSNSAESAITIQNCHIIDGNMTISSDLFMPDTTSNFYQFTNAEDKKIDDYQVVSGCIGGIAGKAADTVVIKDCSNESGNISCDGLKNIGGIVGGAYNGVVIQNCTNNALVSGSLNVAGIAGIADSAVINGCKNTSAITGLEWSGAIWDKIEAAHRNSTTYFSGENAYDAYAPAACIGGIAGRSTTDIVSSENEGQILGLEACGGIAGGTIGNVSYCMNYGSVSYDGNADHTYKNMSVSVVESGNVPFRSNGISFGGIVGSFGFFTHYSEADAAQISYCGNAGEVTALADTAGMLGKYYRNESSSDESEDSTDAVAKVKNCFNAAGITKGTETLQGNDQLLNGVQTLENCFYLTQTEEENTFGRTSMQYKSGQVAWELSHLETENINWAQKLGTQDYPDAAHSKEADIEDTVCRIQFEPYDKNTQEDYSDELTYANMQSTFKMPDKSTNTEEYTYYLGVQKDDLTWEAGEKLEKLVVEGDTVILVKKEKKEIPAEPVKTPDADQPQETPIPAPTHEPAQTAPVQPINTPAATASPVSPADNNNNTNAPSGGNNAQNQTSGSDKAFNKGDQFKANNMNFTVTDKNSVAFKGMDTNKKKVAIPDTIMSQGQKMKVTSIAPGAFEKNTALTDVTLGKNVKEVGSKAFRNCKNLKKVTYSANLQQLGAQSFENCTNLQQVTLPDSVKTIGKKAFKNCKKLKKLTIGKSKKTTKKAGGMLVTSEREKVPSYAALKMKISIGDNAMENCTNLKSVIVNCAVSVIGNSAFKNCTKLSAIIVRSLILKAVGKKALTGVSKCKISVPTKKFKPYRKLFKNKGQGKKVFVAAA